MFYAADENDSLIRDCELIDLSVHKRQLGPKIIYSQCYGRRDLYECVEKLAGAWVMLIFWQNFRLAVLRGGAYKKSAEDHSRNHTNP